MTEPTDDELDKLIRAANPTQGLRHDSRDLPVLSLRKLMREAIAKWGQPAHSGEPVAKLVQAAQAFVLDPTSLQKQLLLEAQAWGPLAEKYHDIKGGQPTRTMTESTDDELDAVIAEYRTHIYPQDMHPRFERAIMRAAIAKWGTPPAVAEPFGWLYEWTHSSTTGRADETYTGFTKDEQHANKHDNCRAVYTEPQPSPTAQGDALDTAIDQARQTVERKMYKKQS